jgi:hypothetical protein
MPGKQIRNWRKYHGLRRKGMSKKRAAKIANSGKKGSKKGGKKGKGGRKK